MSEDYPRLFSAAMTHLVGDGRGANFDQLATEVLHELVGKAPSEAFRGLIGDEGFRTPAVFAVQVVRIFADSGVLICNLIERQAALLVRGSASIPEVAEFERLANISGARGHFRIRSEGPQPQPRTPGEGDNVNLHSTFQSKRSSFS